MFDKLNNWFVNQFVYKKIAKNVVNYFVMGYSVGKKERPEWSDREILVTLTSADKDDDFNKTFVNNKDFINECCITIHGACYLKALWWDIANGMWKFRSETMIKYIDTQLQSKGYPLQSAREKDTIIDTMSKFKLKP